MSRFDQYLEAAKYLIGYKVLATKDGVRRYIAKDGKLTDSQKEAFLFNINIKNIAIKEVLKGFEKQYKNLGYDLHYNKVYETREDNE